MRQVLKSVRQVVLTTNAELGVAPISDCQETPIHRAGRQVGVQFASGGVVAI